MDTLPLFGDQLPLQRRPRKPCGPARPRSHMPAERRQTVPLLRQARPRKRSVTSPWHLGEARRPTGEAPSATQMLGLEGLEVTAARMEGRWYTIHATVTGRPEEDGLGDWTVKDSRVTVVMDVPHHRGPTRLIIKRRRFCRPSPRRESNPVGNEPVPKAELWIAPLPGVVGRLTERLRTYLVQEAARKTFAELGAITGLSPSGVAAIFKNEVEKYRGAVVDAPRYLGIDEVHIGQKNNKKIYFVATDLERNKIIAILPSRGKRALIQWFQGLNDPERLEVVVMDFYKTYADCVRQVFGDQVKIIYDWRHFTEMPRAIMNEIRTESQRACQTDKNSQAIRCQLRRDTRLLNARPFKLHRADKLVLAGLLANFPDLRAAYDLKEGLLNLAKAANRQRAGEMLDQWVASIPDDLVPRYQSLVDLIASCRNELLNYFDVSRPDGSRLTGGMVENNNGRIKRLAARGNGYGFDMLRAKALAAYGDWSGNR